MMIIMVSIMTTMTKAHMMRSMTPDWTSAAGVRPTRRGCRRESGQSDCLRAHRKWWPTGVPVPRVPMARVSELCRCMRVAACHPVTCVQGQGKRMIIMTGMRATPHGGGCLWVGRDSRRATRSCRNNRKCQQVGHAWMRRRANTWDGTEARRSNNVTTVARRNKHEGRCVTDV